MRIPQISILYCLAICLPHARAQTFTVLHSFQGPDGSSPLGALVLGKSGVLYGATESGGNGNGTVYALTPLGAGAFAQSVVFEFAAISGQGPSGNLLSVNGNLFGTAPEGGTSGAGTVFQLTPGVNGAPWTESTLYNFEAVADGRGPYAGLTAGAAGVLYGTTTYGGNASCINGLGCGTVFQLTPPAVAGGAWTEAILYRFQLGTDGINPIAGLTLASDGALYGTTSGGGTSNAGTVFQLTPPAIAGGPWTESIIYNFESGADGEEPLAALAMAKSGNLFGVTLGGGGSGCGTAFSLKPPVPPGNTWAKATIHSFNCSDGAYPEGGLLLKGNVLYGTASGGGSAGAGVIFALKPPLVAGLPWTETTLYNLQPATDGANPVAALISGINDNVLGTAMSGGPGNQGTVFRLTP